MATKAARFKNKSSSLLSITILVVDDDVTTLSIVSAMLRSPKYKESSSFVGVNVATVKDSMEALSTIRTQRNIDLVITDLHMPGMNGIELKKVIDQEFKLPVVIMSADDKETVILETLASGAVSYIVKPVKPNDLKNIWQFAVASKKGKSVTIEGIGSIPNGLLPSAKKMPCREAPDTSSTVKTNQAVICASGDKGRRPPSKRGRDDDNDDDDDDDPYYTPPKKAKVVWTNSLHDLFLQAIRYIGLEKAVPKKILEFMNVPGLTRENVASHLQKYRIFLRRVTERGVMSSREFSRTMSSSFALGHFGAANRRVPRHQYPRSGAGSSNTSMSRMGYSTQPNFLRNQASPNTSFIGSSVLPIHNSPNTSTFGAGSSNIRSNSSLGTWGARSDIIKSNSSLGTLGVESNIIQSNLSFGTPTYHHMNVTNQIATLSRLFNPGSSSTNHELLRPTARASGPNGYNLSVQSIRCHSNGSIYNNNYNNNMNNNYTGIRINTDGEFLGIGQNMINCGNGFGAGFGLMNKNLNDIYGNNNNAPMFSATRQAMHNTVSQQGSGFTLPNLGYDQMINTNHNNIGGGNDFELFNHVMKDVNFELDKLSLRSTQQNHEAPAGNFFLEPINNQTSTPPQQGSVGSLNPNMLNNSSINEINFHLNRLLNSEPPAGENSPWNGQALDEPGIMLEETVSPQGYHPTLNENINQEQVSGGSVEPVLGVAANSVENDSSNTLPFLNQDLMDDIMDYLLDYESF